MSNVVFRDLQKQRGVALFTVLIFLISLTILALASMRGANLGERMARNGSDRQLAMHAAEAALRDAENDILCKLSDGRTDCDANKSSKFYRGAGSRPLGTGGMFNDQVTDCVKGECPTVGGIFMTGYQTWEATAKWANAATYGQFTGATAIPMVAQQPRYLIQRLDVPVEIGKDEVPIFSIYAIGYGADANTQVLLQETYYPGL
jgi:type IV pilus assembly protein PilX